MLSVALKKNTGGRNNKCVCNQYCIKFCVDQQKSCTGLYVCGCDPHTRHRLPLVTCRNNYSKSIFFFFFFFLPPPPSSLSSLVQSRLIVLVLALLECRSQGEMKWKLQLLQLYSASSCWVYSLGFRCMMLNLAGKSTTEGIKAVEASMKRKNDVEEEERVGR